MKKNFYKQVNLGFTLLEFLMILTGAAFFCGSLLLLRNGIRTQAAAVGLFPVSVVSALYLLGQAVLILLGLKQLDKLKKNLLKDLLFDRENPAFLHRCSLYCYGVIMLHLLCGTAGLLLQKTLLQQIQNANPFTSQVTYFISNFQLTFRFDLSLLFWIVLWLLLDCFSFIYRKAIEAYEENQLTF